MFEITNNGPDDVHEFVVIKTDLSPRRVADGRHGAVDESGEGLVIDEVEELAVGASEDWPSPLTQAITC